MAEYLAEAKSLRPEQLADENAAYQRGPRIDSTNAVIGAPPTLIDRNSQLSLSYEHPFKAGTSTFPTLAHYVAYHTISDPNRREEVLKLTAPNLSGILGRVTERNLLEVLVQGVRERVATDATAQRILREYKGNIGYADLYDKVFGIGLAKNDSRALDLLSWTGRNLLGEALMVVRGELGGAPHRLPTLEPQPIVLPSEYVRPVIKGPSPPTKGVEQVVDKTIENLRTRYRKQDGKYKTYKELTELEKKTLTRETSMVNISSNLKGAALYLELVKVLERGSLVAPVATPEILDLKEKYHTAKGYRKYSKTFTSLVEDAKKLGLTGTSSGDQGATLTDKELYENIVAELKKFD